MTHRPRLEFGLSGLRLKIETPVLRAGVVGVDKQMHPSMQSSWLTIVSSG